MSSEEGKASISKLITGLGVFFLDIILAETLHVVYLSNPLGMVWIAGLATSFPFTLGLIYMGARLPTSFSPPVGLSVLSSGVWVVSVSFCSSISSL